MNKLRMSAPEKVVLIACGSFNPITNMHLRLFELARDSLNKTGLYNVIGGIISPVNDKYNKEDLESAKHRCGMIEQALKTSSWIKLDKWECQQDEWLVTAKVLAHHREKLENEYLSQYNHSPRKKKKRRGNEVVPEDNIPRINYEEEPGVRLKLLCGADLLESFGRPGLWSPQDIEDILQNYGLVCVTRCGSDPSKFIYESDVLTKNQNYIHLVTEWIFNDISASKIRRALRRGESVKYLVQDNVIDYFKKHQLYHVPDNRHINHMMPSPNDEALTASPETEEDSLSSIETNSASSPAQRPRYYDVAYQSRRFHTTDTRNVHYTNHYQSSQNTGCINDISSLVRRVKNVRVAYTPETCV